MVAKFSHKRISPSKSNATVSKLLETCKVRRASMVCHSLKSRPAVKLNTGIIGLAHHDSTVSSSLYFGNTGSRASTTYNAQSLCNNWRNTLASWENSVCAAGLARNKFRRSMPSNLLGVSLSSQSKIPPASSNPGVS